MQVDLGSPHQVVAVATQGRHDSYFQQWVTSYKVAYSSDGVTFDSVTDSSGSDLVSCSF